MREIGRGSYGYVLTDGRSAFKFFHSDDNNEQFSQCAKALVLLAGSGVAEDIRPCRRARFYGDPPRPCFRMPVYGPTLHAFPPTPAERATFTRFIVTVVTAFDSRGVCYRDFACRNIARGAAGLVLLDMDSAFVAADAPSTRPAFGSLCPFFGYPADVLPRALLPALYTPAVSMMTMWFAAAAVARVVTCCEDEAAYMPDATPPGFFGVSDVFSRVCALTSSVGFVPPAIVSAADAAVRSYSGTSTSASGSGPMRCSSASAVASADTMSSGGRTERTAAARLPSATGARPNAAQIAAQVAAAASVLIDSLSTPGLTP